MIIFVFITGPWSLKALVILDLGTEVIMKRPFQVIRSGIHWFVPPACSVLLLLVSESSRFLSVSLLIYLLFVF